MNTKSFASRPARERLAASDREALADFYELYFPRVYGYVRRMVGADAEAEDVTSDVFLHLQRAIGQFDPARDPEPWVFTIATNKVRDVWRSSEHGRRQRTVSLDIPENASLVRTTEDVHSDPTRPAERAELREMLDAAIDELPQSLRRVFVLRWTEQMEFRDIARTLDRKEDAVRKRYSRALEHLRAALGGNPLVAQVGPRTPAREGASRLPSPLLDFEWFAGAPHHSPIGAQNS